GHLFAREGFGKQCVAHLLEAPRKREWQPVRNDRVGRQHKFRPWIPPCEGSLLRHADSTNQNIDDQYIDHIDSSRGGATLRSEAATGMRGRLFASLDLRFRGDERGCLASAHPPQSDKRGGHVMAEAVPAAHAANYFSVRQDWLDRRKEPIL